MAEKRIDSKGSKLPENVIQRKDGTYMWKKIVDGKQYCEYAKTLGEIKRKSTTALYEISQGNYRNKKERIQYKKQIEQTEIILNDYFEKWYNLFCVGKMKRSTVMLNKKTYQNYVYKTIGSMKVKDIKQTDIVELLNELVSRGLSYSTIDNVYKILKPIFDMALQNELIQKNPAINSKKGIKKTQKKMIVLSAREQECFFNYLDADIRYSRYKNLFAVGFGLGLRIGEITGLTESDIDFNNNTISINHILIYGQTEDNPNYHFYIDTPKTDKSNRIVPMTQAIRSALKTQIENNKESNIPSYCIDEYRNFVFSGKKGVPHEGKFIWEVIKQIVEKYNLVQHCVNNSEFKSSFLFTDFSA